VSSDSYIVKIWDHVNLISLCSSIPSLFAVHPIVCNTCRQEECELRQPYREDRDQQSGINFNTIMLA